MECCVCRCLALMDAIRIYRINTTDIKGTHNIATPEGFEGNGNLRFFKDSFSLAFKRQDVKDSIAYVVKPCFFVQCIFVWLFVFQTLLKFFESSPEQLYVLEDTHCWIQTVFDSDRRCMSSNPQTRLTHHRCRWLLITPAPYMVLPLFATRFADYAGGIRVSFI